jgi:hypothetical protein
MDLASNIILAGLGVQVLFFGGFVAVAANFHYRTIRNPTTSSMNPEIPWLPLIRLLYVASALILVRSIFRLAEFASGTDSVLQTVEAYFYCLDAALMLVTVVIFNIWHPSSVVSGKVAKTSVDIQLTDV